MIILAYLIAIQIQSIISTILMCGIVFLILWIHKIHDWKQWLLHTSVFYIMAILVCTELFIAPCSIFALQFLFELFHITDQSYHIALYICLILLPVFAKAIAIYKIKKGQNP